MLNPSKKGEHLSSPIERANELNDPKFKNQQGYFSYDLTHQEFITPLYGEITPTMQLVTIPGDRFVIHDNTKLIHNKVNGNLMSTVNQYIDSFYIPLRCLYPTNYEKLIPNPVKGDDLPNTALPIVPLGAFFVNFIESEHQVDLGNGVVTSPYDAFSLLHQYDIYNEDPDIDLPISFALYRLHLLSTILSRGQLLDYLGYMFDTPKTEMRISSRLQKAIDDFQTALFADREYYLQDGEIAYVPAEFISLNSDSFPVEVSVRSYKKAETKEDWRSAISDIYESGGAPIFAYSSTPATTDVLDSALALRTLINDIFRTATFNEDWRTTRSRIDDEAYEFNNNELNISNILAYQQCVAEYFTNDSVDNIFNAELYMQLLRSVMYPPSTDDEDLTLEPVFTYNGVSTEYDLISYGGFFVSLLSSKQDGILGRQHMFATLMFLKRRSLRYGDYFSTARPRMLAVGQLGVNVTDGMVSPVDITQNLLKQRYLNAVNYGGQGFLQYYAMQMGVTPSDTGCTPRFISHRKIELENRITTNTANNQGEQTTNIVGFSDRNAFDVFIDDFGIIISMTSFDCLPVYKSGLDNTLFFADRFDYFNPMLQNIGDQPIKTVELLGYPSLGRVFGYTMRNSEYKYKISRAHGGFVNDLPGYLLSYPLDATTFSESDLPGLKISPDFIRDKPLYFDAIVSQNTGISPAQNYHFVVSCTNQVQAARKIQATPPVLF